MGLVIARNTKTGEWVDGKMPHISDFTVVKSKHVSHGTYKVWAAAKDGWKAELILDRHQLSQFLSPGATIHWGEIFYLTYKLTQPNGKNLRNHNPLAVRRRWSRNSRFGSAGRGPRP